VYQGISEQRIVLAFKKLQDRGARYAGEKTHATHWKSCFEQLQAMRSVEMSLPAQVDLILPCQLASAD